MLPKHTPTIYNPIRFHIHIRLFLRPQRILHTILQPFSSPNIVSNRCHHRQLPTHAHTEREELHIKLMFIKHLKCVHSCVMPFNDVYLPCVFINQLICVSLLLSLPISLSLSSHAYVLLQSLSFCERPFLTFTMIKNGCWPHFYNHKCFHQPLTLCWYRFLTSMFCGISLQFMSYVFWVWRLSHISKLLKLLISNAFVSFLIASNQFFILCHFFSWKILFH